MEKMRKICTIEIWEILAHMILLELKSRVFCLKLIKGKKIRLVYCCLYLIIFLMNSNFEREESFFDCSPISFSFYNLFTSGVLLTGCVCVLIMGNCD